MLTNSKKINQVAALKRKIGLKPSPSRPSLYKEALNGGGHQKRRGAKTFGFAAIKVTKTVRP
jgi:hypothetical protein